MYRTIEAIPYKETKDGTYFIVKVPNESLTDAVKKFSKNGILKGELRLDDGRTITSEQRKKAYATITDIAIYQMDLPIEPTKVLLKTMYRKKSGEKKFSLSNCCILLSKVAKK